ncbi:hypothetical protein PVIIG_05218 [Plasmodium vivax India VII]|uniref:VIR protein n=1 Tax=Plasmodium vivax India VII TaxID=1077284 RepID=A0A0J9S2L7_PLAVI|nr:hypothetical protein PVIIG_05218 [Plasmodium vivax India VII]
MSKNITDIENWKDDYPFLDEVWTTYKKFDNTLEEYNSLYEFICNSYVLKNSNEDIIKYSPFCKKLMRNLGYFSLESKYYEPSHERCNILYNWIYNSKKKGKITDDIINNSFTEYTEHMGRQNNYKICNIDTYDKFYEEPINITLLHIFETNINTIKDKLNDTKEESKIACQKFVCECLAIYNHMNETYCLKPSEQSQKHTHTCLKLSLFRKAYNFLYNKLEDIDPKISSLDWAKNEFLDKCKSYENISAKMMLAVENPHGQPHSRGDQGLTQSSFSGVYNGENQRSPVSSTVSTAFGTVAGASSVLALLYKVNKNFI